MQSTQRERIPNNNHRAVTPNVTYPAFLDLTDANKSRSDLRLMEKRIKPDKYYKGKIGKVFFFEFLTEQQRTQFLLTLITDIRIDGHTAYYLDQSYDINKARK